MSLQHQYSRNTDSHLTQALKREGISEIFDLLLLSQADRDSLTFLDADGLVTPSLLAFKICSR